MRVVSAAILCVAAMAAAFSCKSTTYSLSIDLRTDYAAGTEFALVRTTVGTGGDERREDQLLPASDPRFLDGARVADFPDLPGGTTVIHVKAIRTNGETLGERVVSLSLTGDYALTVVITRSCEGVVCPAPGGDPAATTCDRGKCVRPDCLPPTCTPPECASDAECVPKVACLSGKCSAGACLYAVDDAKCPVGQKCNATTGCGAPPPTCGGSPCGAPNICCNNTCINPQTAQNHCGTCGNACGGMTCCAGKCVDTQVSESHCSRCGNACPAGDECCAGACINVQFSEKHCGSCGNACSGMFPDCCGSKCLSKQQSEMNCGGCGIVCSGTKPVCCAGVCRGSC